MRGFLAPHRHASLLALDPDDSDDPATAAKYVQGRVRLVRATTSLATQLRHGRCGGVIVINLHDGGSLSFYKELRKPVLQYPSLNRPGSENDIKIDIDSDQSIFTRGALRKSLRSSVRQLDVDDSARAEITKVQVSASAEEFVLPIEMPYLHIPANVPWQFKSLRGKLKQTTFQIVVPPSAEGGRDRRVKVMTSKEKETNMRQVTTTILRKELSFASVIRQEQEEDDERNSDYDDVPNSGSKKHAQLFTFRCENSRELAVYTEATQKIGRAHSDNTKRRSFGSLSISLPHQTSRMRDAGGMEVAAQASLINRRGGLTRRLSTIGMQEFRVTPLHAYPNTWMTKKELADELPRTSSHFHDLRKGGPEEIGSVRIELLQCLGMQKMDRYSLSDTYACMVCGASAFTTDVIPDNLNPAWLPKTRRACILPLRNAYSQVCVGTFDYDGEKEEDDFTGRVVLDIPQLQAGCLYDVTLPLRHTSRVYNRRRFGCVRLRIRVNWTHGERPALLSYIPKSPADITKRLNKAPPAPVVVWCPDSKSFQNVCRTLYGADIPGKFNSSIATAVSREVTMISRVVEYHTRRIVRDIIRWNNPLLSGYIFTAWMYFVRHDSLNKIPSFVLSLALIFMMRNHIKYNSHSGVGSFYGRKSIRAMCRTLLFNRHDPNVHASQAQRASFNQTLADWLVSKVFRISTTSVTMNSWKEEDNSEFPFSSGSHHPKICQAEASATQVWNGREEESLGLDDDEDEWNSDEEEEGLRQSYNQMVKRMSLEGKPTKRRGSVSKAMKDMLPVEIADDATTLTGSTQQMPMEFGTTLVIPDQNVRAKVAKKKKETSMLQDIEKIHRKVSRANLHLFDDRVFLAEDREGAQKLLALNKTKNPIKRMMNPVAGGVMKIFDIQISFFRAMFNICMWKDPMLSFWFSLLIFCLMIVLFIFPWRLFFCVAGLLGLGPQNYFLVPLYHAKRASRSKAKPVAGDCGQTSRINTAAVSNSPLLFRDNMQMKPDGKQRGVIVPGGDCVFRFNRFYDWPPDPATTTIKEEM